MLSNSTLSSTAVLMLGKDSFPKTLGPRIAFRPTTDILGRMLPKMGMEARSGNGIYSQVDESR